ncbi:MAG TPA: ABC transporter permease [Casimicrobiaceae bacterium]|jgi:putative spermidine/putrescine transport system permease protein
MTAAALPRAREGAVAWSAAVMLVPASLIVAIGIVIPIVILFRYSLNQFTPAKVMVDAFTAENYVKFFTDPFYIAVLLRTIRVAAVCTAICVAVGFPMAYVLARTRSRYKNLLLLIVILPLFVGNAVRAAGWMVLFGNRGFVNEVAMALGLVRAPLQIMYTEFAVVVGIVAVNLPFVVLTLQAALEGIERPIEEAALGLGAGPLRTFRHVILPLAMPGVIAGTILSFILAMNAYATPVLLGGPTFHMMGPTVYDQFAGLTNWPFGAALAFVLMTATLLLTVASNWLAHRRLRR